MELSSSHPKKTLSRDGSDIFAMAFSFMARVGVDGDCVRIKLNTQVFMGEQYDLH